MVGKRASTESTSRSSIESGSSWRAIHRSTPTERTAASSPGRGPNAKRLSTCRARSSALSAPSRRVAGATAVTVGVDAACVVAHAAPAQASTPSRGRGKTGLWLVAVEPFVVVVHAVVIVIFERPDRLPNGAIDGLGVGRVHRIDRGAAGILEPARHVYGDRDVARSAAHGDGGRERRLDLRIDLRREREGMGRSGR